MVATFVGFIGYIPVARRDLFHRGRPKPVWTPHCPAPIAFEYPRRRKPRFLIFSGSWQLSRYFLDAPQRHSLKVFPAKSLLADVAGSNALTCGAPLHLQ